MAVWKNSETIATDPFRVITVLVSVLDAILLVLLVRACVYCTVSIDLLLNYLLTMK